MTVREKVNELLKLNSELRSKFTDEINYEMSEIESFNFEFFGGRFDSIEYEIRYLPFDKMNNENIHSLLDLRKKMLLNSFDKGHHRTFLNMSNHLPDDIHLDLKIHGF